MTTTTTEKEQLIEVLSNLSNYDSSQGIWFDENFNYGFGSFQFDNGGFPESWECLGSLKELIDDRDNYYPPSDSDWDEDVARDMAKEWAESILLA